MWIDAGGWGRTLVRRGPRHGAIEGDDQVRGRQYWVRRQRITLMQRMSRRKIHVLGNLEFAHSDSEGFCEAHRRSGAASRSRPKLRVTISGSLACAIHEAALFDNFRVRERRASGAIAGSHRAFQLQLSPRLLEQVAGK